MNWDMIGSLADWFAAVGTISAVVVALRIASGESRRREAERQADARALASIVCNELRMTLLKLRTITQIAVAGGSHQKELANSLAEQIQSLRTSTLELAIMNFALLSRPAPHAIAGLTVVLGELKTVGEVWRGKGERRIEAAATSLLFVNARVAAETAVDMCEKTLALMDAAAGHEFAIRRGDTMLTGSEPRDDETEVHRPAD